MTDNRPQSTDQAAIKRYLFGEISGDERELFEEMLFIDDDLFANVAAIEDDLVDGYVAGELSSGEYILFERSLTTMPARRRKVRNARVIREFIHDEKALLPTAKAVSTPANAGLWTKIAGLFEFRSPITGFAFAGLSLLLFVSTFALYWSNSSLRDENAQLHSSTSNIDDLRSREQKLNRALDESKEREAGLKARINDESDAKENLTSDLINERENRKQLETEIARIDRVPPRANGNTPGGQSVQTLSLGNTSSQTQDPTTSVKLGNAAKQMAIVVKLPDWIAADESLTVAVNGKRIGGTFSPRADANGGKHITVWTAVSDLQPGTNKITVQKSAGVEVTSYSFSAEK